MHRNRALKDIADIKLGLAFKSAVKEGEGNGSCFLIQTKDITNDGFVNYDALPDVIPEGRFDNHVVDVDDIVMRLRGPVFSASIIEKPLRLPITTTNQLAIIRCNKELVSPYYLLWFLNHSLGQRYFAETNEGTNISKINVRTLSEMPISTPKMKDQIRIGEINRNWLQQKELHRKLIENGDKFYSEVCNKIYMGMV